MVTINKGRKPNLAFCKWANQCTRFVLLRNDAIRQLKLPAQRPISYHFSFFSFTRKKALNNFLSTIHTVVDI